MQWTVDQLKAIENRKTNMLVSAAAGSGKTALLIERIKRIVLEEKVGVDELLILTFTRGAAGEMKNRLSQALAKELENTDNDRGFLMRQMNILGGASISTLHSFCLAVLRQYFHKVDMDPGFSIGNDAEMTLMRKETMEEVFEEAYLESGDAAPSDEKDNGEDNFDFLGLVEKYSGNKSDQALQETVEDLHRFLATQPNPDAWIDMALRQFDVDVQTIETSIWGQSLQKIMLTEIQGALSSAVLAMQCSDCSGFEKTYDQMKEEVRFLQELKIQTELELVSALDILRGLHYERFKGNSKQDKALNEAIKKYRDEAKKGMMALQKRFASNLDEMVVQLNQLEKPMMDLVTLTRRFGSAFQAKKAKKNLVDYNDLEQLTLKVLQDQEVADEIQAHYRYVFLDEYQDTNEMQETILQRIVRENNYFMVGDVKQSIYRFRLADPTIFIGKYETFGKNENPNNALVTLNQNFRSARGVISGVNAIFERIMTTGLGEINYDEQARLNQGLPNHGPHEKVEIHVLEEKKAAADIPKDGVSEPVGFEEETTVEQEARFVAKKIQSLVGTPFYDTRKGVERPIVYGDFGVLMRSVAGRGDVYRKIFSEMGIPTYFDGGTNYYESLEMTIILNLLTLMDNHHQDLPLLSVMTSPIGQFTSSDCAKLRIEYPDGFFYQAVENYCAGEQDALAEKLAVFYEKLDNWRDESKRMPIEDFLWKLYLESGYYAFVRALPGGEQRQCNLRILLKRAGDYKKSTLKGLYQFVRFVENMKKYKQDISPPSVISNDEAVVKLMTIHKSKGLEFPIVFLTGTGKAFNKRSNYNQILFHKNLGICPDYVDLEKRVKYHSLAKEVCREQSNIEMLSEEMRLLYVGMTRAEEKLYIVGMVKNREKAEQKWTNPPDVYHLLGATSHLDWTMLGILGGKEAPYDLDPDHLELNDFKIWWHTGREADDASSPEETKGENDAPMPNETPVLISETTREAIVSRLRYRYPTTEDDALPNKMSVTEIKNVKKQKELGEGVEMSAFTHKRTRPKFLEEKQTDFTPTQRGTATHLLMEKIALDPIRMVYSKSGKAGVESFLKGHLLDSIKMLVEKDFLPKALADTIDIRLLVRFYTSELGIRLLLAEHVKRELPFNYACDPAQVRSEWTGIKEKILVQGIIDCAFMEDGCWVIVDYKTDFFRNQEQREEILSGYVAQTDFYARALMALTGIPVKEKIIALITLGEMIVA